MTNVALSSTREDECSEEIALGEGESRSAFNLSQYLLMYHIAVPPTNSYVCLELGKIMKTTMMSSLRIDAPSPNKAKFHMHNLPKNIKDFEHHHLSCRCSVYRSREESLIDRKSVV